MAYAKPSDIYELVFPAMPGVLNLEGGRGLGSNAVPRCVWIPKSGTFGTSTFTKTERPLQTVRFLWDVHCHGANLDGAWEVLRQLVGAVNQTLGHQYELGNLQVPDDGTGHASQRSVLLIVPLMVDIDLLDPKNNTTTVKLQSFTWTGGADNDQTLTIPRK